MRAFKRNQYDTQKTKKMIFFSSILFTLLFWEDDRITNHHSRMTTFAILCYLSGDRIKMFGKYVREMEMKMNGFNLGNGTINNSTSRNMCELYSFLILLLISQLNGKQMSHALIFCVPKRIHSDRLHLSVKMLRAKYRIVLKWK